MGKTINCMSMTYIFGGAVFNDDRLLYVGSELQSNINDASNIIFQRAFIERDPLYEYIYGVVVDGQGNQTEAAKHYRKAADAGIVQAMFALGECYVFGEGVSQSIKKGMDLLKRADELGNASAKVRLGIMYDLGQAGRVDHLQAAYYYEMAAMENHPIAQRNIAYDYSVGEGVIEDYESACFWYKAAAENGEPGSQGWCRSRGIGFTAPESTDTKSLITSVYYHFYES